MRKNKLYRLTNIFLAVVYGAVVLIQHQFNLVFFNNAQTNWFMLLCLFVGVSMAVKAFIFTSDSSLWLSVLLIMVAASMFSFNYFVLSFNNYWPVVLSVISVASIITGLVFREIYQIKIFLTLSYFSVPCYLFSLSVIEPWVFVLLLIGALAVSFITIALLPARWYSKNLKIRQATGKL